MSARVVKCPACGLRVVMDSAANTIRHEAPNCAEFIRRVEAAGLKAIREPWAVVVDPITGKVKDPGKA